MPPGQLTSECEARFNSSFLPAKGTPGYFTEWQQAPVDDSPVGGRVQRDVALISEERSDGA